MGLTQASKKQYHYVSTRQPLGYGGLVSQFGVSFGYKVYNAISNCIKCKKKNPRLLIEGFFSYSNSGR